MRCVFVYDSLSDVFSEQDCIPIPIVDKVSFCDPNPKPFKFSFSVAVTIPNALADVVTIAESIILADTIAVQIADSDTHSDPIPVLFAVSDALTVCKPHADIDAIFFTDTNAVNHANTVDHPVAVSDSDVVCDAITLPD